MSMIELIPEADVEGFIQDVKRNYTGDRFDSVSKTWHDDVPRVTVVSGEHPAYSRFVKDLRKCLYRHGFVLWSADRKKITGGGGRQGIIRRHKVTGIPIAWVIAEMNGYTCNTGSCMRLIHSWDSEYCEKCVDFNISKVNEDKNIETIY